jgi:hypothetical protein
MPEMFFWNKNCNSHICMNIFIARINQIVLQQEFLCLSSNQKEACILKILEPHADNFHIQKEKHTKLNIRKDRFLIHGQQLFYQI